MIYASTGCVRAPRDLWAVLDAYEAAGLERVELGACTLDPTDDLVPRLRRRGLSYLVHNYFPPPQESFVLNLASPEPALAARSLAFVLAALELCAELGAPVYSVHPGFVGDPERAEDGHFVLPPGDAEAARVRLVDALAIALARAGELGVRLAVETLDVLPPDVGRVVPATPDDFRSLLAELDGLAVLLDTGHASVSARTLGLDARAYSVPGRVAAVHAHENDGVADRHLPVSAGGPVLPLLRSLADLPISVEAHFDDATALAAHVRWLEEQLEP